MTLIEHLLICLSEEANEVGQAVSKALRFGLQDDFTDKTPEELIKEEFSDLVAVYECLLEAGVHIHVSTQLKQAKKDKLHKFVEYAKAKGKISE